MYRFLFYINILKMNRIILIGNGFDLAHDLKTNYRDFLDDYWIEWCERLFNHQNCHLSDEFYEFSIKRGDQLASGEELKHLIYLFNIHWTTNRTLEQMRSGEQIVIKSFESLVQLCEAVNAHHLKEGSPSQICHQYTSNTSELFATVNKAYLEKWVDIENEYYRLLKKIHDEQSNPSMIPYDMDKPKKELMALNTDLKTLEGKLINYLSKIQEDKITDDIVNEQIKQKIYGKIDIRDISNDGQELFLDGLFSEISNLPGGMCVGEIEEEMRKHPEYYIMNTEKEAYREMIKDKLSKDKLGNYLRPNRTLLLNFNYTNTARKLYNQSVDGDECELIHIHGELNNADNPVIFGYGDEMDEHYKKILDLNDNSYLQNIKSIHYLETDNYRRLLAFADSAPYQIYIMGHSCGNSDRTLLNTLFEHKNCISIKPYFHKKDDGTDNYIDIVQNISRNFKDMALMRDRVVNKGYCEPLVRK